MRSGVADDDGDDEDMSKTKGGRRFSMMLVDPDRHVTKVNKRERKKGVANLNVRILQESASLNGGESGEDLTQLRVADATEERESDTLREMTALTRKVARDEHKLDKEIEANLRRSEETLEERMWEISETDRIESARAQQLKSNHELKETFVVEVDNLLAHQQHFKASKLYAKKQIDLSLPDWFKTLEEMIQNTRATGHSNKLRWRSKACGLLRRCILESEDDDEALASRTSMRDLALKINQYNAAKLVAEAQQVKDAYIEHCQINATHFGKSSKLMLESEEQIDRHSIVPMMRTDWSAKLDDADSVRKSQAMASVESWSTISRPATLTNSQVSELFGGGATKLLPLVQGGGGDHTAAAGDGGTMYGEGEERHYQETLQVPAVPALKTLTPAIEKGALKGGNYQVHPPGLTQVQTQAVMRMRAAAAMGNYEVTRSIFVKNFDGPERVKAGKISVGRKAPTMEEFRILMISFKNAPELRFEDAFEVFDLVESYQMFPDVSMYNIMMRACERESRWRRVIAMYRDLLHVHRLVPNVQTFDIIVDCCRHSMEEPGVIYEELRKLGLPTDYCYKAALTNAGNRIPSQVLYETMHDVTNAPLPSDGRFERQVKRDKELAMRARGVAAVAETVVMPDGHRVAAPTAPGDPFPRTSLPFPGEAAHGNGNGNGNGNGGGEDDTSTIISNDSRPRGGRGSEEGGRWEHKDNGGGDKHTKTQVQVQVQAKAQAQAQAKAQAQAHGGGRTQMKKSSYWEDDVTGGKGTLGTDPKGSLYYEEKGEGEKGAVAVLLGRNTDSGAYVGAALSPSQADQDTRTAVSWLDNDDDPRSSSYLNCPTGTGTGPGERSEAAFRESSVISQESVEQAVTGKLLNDKVDQYQWDRFTGKLKALLPATSPIKTRGFGEKHQQFETQVMRSMPASKEERKELSERSVSFMRSLEARDRRSASATSLTQGGITTAVGEGLVEGGDSVGSLGVGTVALGEAAFTPSQSAVLPGSEENETDFLKDMVNTWKDRDQKAHDPLGHHHHAHSNRQGQTEGEDEKGGTDRALELGDTASMLAEASYLDNQGRAVHAHSSLELGKHQYTVPYTGPSPAEYPSFPDGSASHEQVLAELGRWREGKAFETAEGSLEEQARTAVTKRSLNVVFEDGDGVTRASDDYSLDTLDSEIARAKARERKKKQEERKKRGGAAPSSRFAYDPEKARRETLSRKEEKRRQEEDLAQAKAMALTILEQNKRGDNASGSYVSSSASVGGDESTVYSKESIINASLKAKAMQEAKRPFRTRTHQTPQRDLQRMPQQRDKIMLGVAQTITRGGEDPASRYRERMKAKPL